MRNELREKNGYLFALFCLCLFVTLAIFNSSTAEAATGIPQILNHQGRLLNASGTLLGGAGTPYCFKFSFYDDATPGGPDTKLWPSGAPTTTTAIVRNGIFNVGIGDTSQGGDVLDFDFQTNDTAYLNVDVAAQVGGSCGGGDENFETLSPRQRIYSSGYAINAGRLSGYTAAQNASGTQIPVLTSGNLVLGGTNPQLNATGTNALVLQGGTGTGNIQFFNSSNFITSTGTLLLGGLITATNINQFVTTTSSPTFAGITVSGPAGLQAFTFSNATGTGNLQIGTLTATGAASLDSLSVTNSSALAGLTFSNATGTGNLQAATLRTTGAATLDSLSVTNLSGLQGVTFSNATGTGNLEVGTLNTTGAASLSSLTVVGASGLQSFTFTNATGTGNFQVGTFTATGVANLQGVTFTNATGTGNIQAGSINNTPIGATTASTGMFSNATTTGTFTAQGAGLFQNALAVSSGNFTVSSGVSALQGITFTNATGTGNLQVATLNTTGAASLNSLAVTNLSALNGVTFSNATGTTLSLSSGTDTPLSIVQSSSSQYFVQMVNGSGIEQFRVDGNGSVFANGFIAKQMQFSEEFLRTSASAANDIVGGGTTGLGDTFSWGVGSTGNGHVAVVPSTDAVNGAMQIRVTGGTARAALLYLSAGAANRNDVLDADNKPVIVMKLRPTVVGANNLIFAGMADFTDGVVTDPTNGIYFTNAGGTTWVGVARSGGVQSSVTCTGQTISTTVDAYFRIQVYSSSSVEFFMDNDTSDGINTTSCGVVTSNIPVSAMTAEIMNEVRTGGTQPADVLVDYIRINQDDPITGSPGEVLPPEPGAGADLAEEIGAFEPETTEPGDVLAILSDASVTVTKSQMPYEKNLYGVVTTNPGHILGNGTSNSVRIALAGRVPVKVNLENGPVAVGDWLTSSNERGVAMRATRNGMVLGRALEAFDGSNSDQNKILATVEVQYYGGFASTSGDGTPLISFIEDNSFLADVAHAISDFAELTARSASNFVRVVADAVTAKVGEFVNLFAKDITVMPDGSLALPAGNNQISGTGFIPARTFDALVSNTKVTQGSKIFLTPLGQASVPLYIKEKIPGVGFRVGVGEAQESDVAFDWAMFDSYDPSTLLAASAVSLEADASSSNATIETNNTDTATEEIQSSDDSNAPPPATPDIPTLPDSSSTSPDG